MKDFKFIRLTSFLLKTLEKLFDGYLKERPLKLWPHHEEQHVYCTGRVVEIVLFSVVGFIEDQIEYNGMCVGVFLDLKGSFSRTLGQDIPRSAEEQGISRIVIDWIIRSLECREMH